MNKGEELNKRIWTLFEKAGFVTYPNSSGDGEVTVPIGRGRPLDLFAEVPDLNVRIIGSNKSGKKPKAGVTWTGHMNDLDALRKKVSADKALLVVVGHELDDKDLAHAKSLGLVVWSEENLNYYEELAETVGEFAKYEIIHTLGINTKEESQFHKVLALKVNQPTKTGLTEVYVFSLSPEHLLKTSVIYRKAQGHADAYQRMLRRSRLPKIAAFVEEPDAILPTDIILHLDDTVDVRELSIGSLKDGNGSPASLSNTNQYCPVVLDIPLRYASMEIIDGQHRLYGFVKASLQTRRDFNLVVVGVKKLTEKQKRETFVAINDNSRRMDPNLVAYLKYTPDDVLCKADPSIMAIRVVVELNKRAPLKKAIKLLDNGKEKITLKGLSGYDMKSLVGTRGQLRKYNPDNDPNEYISMLALYFSIFRAAFRTEWDKPGKYLIATNRGLSGLLKLLKSILKYEKAWPTEERLKEYANALKSHWTWDIVKLKRTYVGGQGWGALHKDIVTAIKRDKKFKSFKA